MIIVNVTSGGHARQREFLVPANTAARRYKC